MNQFVHQNITKLNYKFLRKYYDKLVTDGMIKGQVQAELIVLLNSLAKDAKSGYMDKYIFFMNASIEIMGVVNQ